MALYSFPHHHSNVLFLHSSLLGDTSITSSVLNQAAALLEAKLAASPLSSRRLPTNSLDNRFFSGLHLHDLGTNQSSQLSTFFANRLMQWQGTFNEDYKVTLYSRNLNPEFALSSLELHEDNLVPLVEEKETLTYQSLLYQGLIFKASHYGERQQWINRWLDPRNILALEYHFHGSNYGKEKDQLLSPLPYWNGSRVLSYQKLFAGGQDFLPLILEKHRAYYDQEVHGCFCEIDYSESQPHSSTGICSSLECQKTYPALSLAQHSPQCWPFLSLLNDEDLLAYNLMQKTLLEFANFQHLVLACPVYNDNFPVIIQDYFNNLVRYGYLFENCLPKARELQGRTLHLVMACGEASANYQHLAQAFKNKTLARLGIEVKVHSFSYTDCFMEGKDAGQEIKTIASTIAEDVYATIEEQQRNFATLAKEETYYISTLKDLQELKGEGLPPTKEEEEEVLLNAENMKEEGIKLLSALEGHLIYSKARYHLEGCSQSLAENKKEEQGLVQEKEETGKRLVKEKVKAEKTSAHRLLLSYRNYLAYLRFSPFSRTRTFSPQEQETEDKAFLDFIALPLEEQYKKIASLGIHPAKYSYLNTDLDLELFIFNNHYFKSK